MYMQDILAFHEHVQIVFLRNVLVYARYFWFYVHIVIKLRYVMFGIFMSLCAFQEDFKQFEVVMFWMYQIRTMSLLLHIAFQSNKCFRDLQVLFFPVSTMSICLIDYHEMYEFQQLCPLVRSKIGHRMPRKHLLCQRYIDIHLYMRDIETHQCIRLNHIRSMRKFIQ